MKKLIIKPKLLIIYTIAIVLIGTIACNRNKEIKEPQFFMIEKNGSPKSTSEIFVIANPPKDTTKLKSLVEQFNLNSIPIDTLKKFELINRSFYRETNLLTRDYKRFEPYPNEDELGWYEKIYYKNQDLVRHHDDLIMVTMYDRLKDNSIFYRYCFNYEDYLSNMHGNIIDIDSLYLKGFGF